jgi:hypothetical protein
MFICNSGASSTARRAKTSRQLVIRHYLSLPESAVASLAQNDGSSTARLTLGAGQFSSRGDSTPQIQAFHISLHICNAAYLSSAVPSGLALLRHLVPNVETLGYCRLSLREQERKPAVPAESGGSARTSSSPRKLASPRSQLRLPSRLPQRGRAALETVQGVGPSCIRPGGTRRQ